MGTRGPVPKRSSERRRRNKDSQVESVVYVGSVEVPPAEGHWHPIAVGWYESLSESGQSQFFEPSDWAQARFVAEAMTKNLESSRFSSELFKAILAGMADLLTSEAARRRVRLEIERQLDEPGEVTDLDEFKRRLKSGS